MESKKRSTLPRVGLLLLVAFFMGNDRKISDLVFSPAAAGGISGMVRDQESGDPIGGVQLILYQGNDPNSADEDAYYWVSSTHTDAEGEYRFDDLPERRYRIEAPSQEVEGQCYLEANQYDIQVFDDAETAVDFELRKGVYLCVSVTNEQGDPVNAWIGIMAPWTRDGPDYYDSYVHVNEYRFCVPESPGNFYPVFVQNAYADGVSYASKWDGRLYKADSSESCTEVTYVLEPGGSVSGRVVNEDGVGIGNVLVMTEGNHTTWGRFTDNEGYYKIPGMPEGTVYVELNAEVSVEFEGIKYQPSARHKGPFEIVAGQDVNVGELTIYKAGRITGVVTDDEGDPVPYAEVELEGKDSDGNEIDLDELTTDLEGRFATDFAAPGEYSLFCWAEGYMPAFMSDIIVGSEEETKVDVVLKGGVEPAVLSGRISNYSYIAAYDAENDVFYPYYDDADYEKYGITGYRFGMIAIRMGQQYMENDFLSSESLFIGDAEAGEDIEDGYGDYFEIDPDEIPGNYTMPLLPGDAAIALYIEYNPSGDYGSSNVVLYDWKRITMTEGTVIEEINFTADPVDTRETVNTGIIKGDLIVPEGYSYFPEDWCMVYAYALDEEGHPDTAIPFGNAVSFCSYTKCYEFRGMPPGRYLLKAFARSLPLAIVPSVTVSVDETTLMDITFTSGGTLSGTVSDGTGGIDRARVTVVETGESVHTDESGGYTIQGVTPGAYTVIVKAPGFAEAERGNVTLADGVETTENFILDSAVGRLSGTVATGGGAPLNGVQLVAYNKTDHTWKTTQTIGGAFTVEDLTPGEYILAVDAGALGYGTVVHPSDGTSIDLQPNQSVQDIQFVVAACRPPVFTFYATADESDPPVLSIEFSSNMQLPAEPEVTVVTGAGALGSLASNALFNRFSIQYTADAADETVEITIAESAVDPVCEGNQVSMTFSFPLDEDLGITSVIPALGGEVKMMGTQDCTKIYVPPFAIAGVEDAAKAIPLVIRKSHTPDNLDDLASAVYDFSFLEDGIEVDVNRRFKVTMSFFFPDGMSRDEFEETVEIRYFDAVEKQWITDGIFSTFINWADMTITYEVSHLSKFAAFMSSTGTPFIRGDANTDDNIDIADAIFILSYLFSDGAPAGCMDSADTNDDGSVDVSDVVCILVYLFAGGDPLSEPFQACGGDPTPDNLNCLSYEFCR